MQHDIKLQYFLKNHINRSKAFRKKNALSIYLLYICVLVCVRDVCTVYRFHQKRQIKARPDDPE